MMYSSLYLRDPAISEELDAGHYFKFSGHLIPSRSVAKASRNQRI